jgi:futalosine hydrolase
MKQLILLVSATSLEIQPTIDFLKENPNPNVEVLVTGIGMMATTFALTKRLSKGFEGICINVGIAGAFPKTIEIGTVFQVEKERLGDFGVENPDGSMTELSDLGFHEIDPIFENKWIHNPHGFEINLPKTSGLTVNKVSGSEHSILLISHLADIETMESAAFFYVCRQFEIPFIALRSISNYVEPRNKENWEIQLAVKRLNDELIMKLNELQ